MTLLQWMRSVDSRLNTLHTLLAQQQHNHKHEQHEQQQQQPLQQQHTPSKPVVHQLQRKATTTDQQTHNTRQQKKLEHNHLQGKRFRSKRLTADEELLKLETDNIHRAPNLNWLLVITTVILFNIVCTPFRLAFDSPYNHFFICTDFISFLLHVAGQILPSVLNFADFFHIAQKRGKEEDDQSKLSYFEILSSLPFNYLFM